MGVSGFERTLHQLELIAIVFYHWPVEQTGQYSGYSIAVHFTSAGIKHIHYLSLDRLAGIVVQYSYSLHFSWC